jgi:hypothetical protein
MTAPARADHATALALLLVALVWGINGIYLAPLSRLGMAPFWAADLAQWVLLPTLLLAWLHRLGLRPGDCGFGAPGRVAPLLLSALVATLLFHLCFFGVRDLAWRLMGHPTGFFALEDVFPGGPAGRVVWLYSALSAGIVESVFFIGLPWWLWQRRQVGGALQFSLVSSVVFALVHWEQGAHVVVAALAFGLVACAFFLRQRHLWAVAIGHVAVDLVAFW